MTQTILESVQIHWQDLRGRTYDLMDVLADIDLNARLPFPESQNILYQFYCMLGTQESWPPVLLEGGMQGWDCSLKLCADARRETATIHEEHEKNTKNCNDKKRGGRICAEPTPSSATWRSANSQTAPAGEVLPVERVRQGMEAADATLLATFEKVDWLQVFENGSTPLAGYYRLVEHEAHHHGQLINLIYANNLPIPESWADSWALTRDE